MIKRLWIKITNKGIERFTDDKEIKYYKILNSLLLVIILLMAIAFFLISLIPIVDESFRKIESFHLIFKYDIVSITAGIIFILLLKLSIISGRLILIRYLNLILAYTIVIIYSLMAGIGIGVHLFLLFLVFFPIFYHDVSKLFKFFEIFFLFSLTFFIFYVLYQSKPLYPFPIHIETILFLTISSLVLGTSVVLIIFLSWQFGWHLKLKNLWNKYTYLGAEKFTNEEDIKSHKILNNGLMIATILTAFLIVSIFLIPVYDVSFIQGERLNLVLTYLSMQILYMLVYAAVFYINFRVGKTLLFNVIIHLVAFSHITGLSFMLGHKIGIQYFLLPIIFFPLFYAKIKIFTKLIISIPNMLLISIIIFVQYSEPAIYPVPNHIVDIGFRIIVSFLSGTFGVMGIYIWWQFNITRKIINFWEYFSKLGSKNFSDARSIKLHIIMNQVILLFIIILTLAVGGTYIIFMIIIYYDESILLFPYLLYYVPPLVTMLSLTIIGFYIRVKSSDEKRNELILSILITAGTIFILYISMLAGSAVNFHLYILVLLPLPFFIFRTSSWKSVLILIVIIAFLFLFAQWYNMNYLPIKPAPTYLNSPAKYIIAIFILVGIIFSCYYLWEQTSRAENLLLEEQAKSENLLLNILPLEIATELKEKGVSDPVRYDSVSILFTDFVGFTQIAENLESKELLGELDKCFSYFDNVTKRYNLEKIKTIGDSYMLAGGLPEENNTHPFDCTLAALEIQAFMNQMKEIKDGQGLPYWEMRLGINTGPVVAGVIGEMKFAYDIFGDSVNTASRMESSGTPGKINISLETYNEVKFLFDCEHRGKVPAKRKGDIDMFYVNGIKRKYSVKGEGRVPNDRFKEIYEKLKGGAKLVAKPSA